MTVRVVGITNSSNINDNNSNRHNSNDNNRKVTRIAIITKKLCIAFLTFHAVKKISFDLVLLGINTRSYQIGLCPLAPTLTLKRVHAFSFSYPFLD